MLLRVPITLLLCLLLSGLTLSELDHCEAGCDGRLLVGAFNVQVFGQSKASKDDVMYYLVKILARYDLVVVQEIRDSKETAFPTLVEQLNEATEGLYESEVGLRVGRSSSKEQYGFIYKKDKLEIEHMYQNADDDDVFEREPVVIRFRRKTDVGQQRAFTFIPMHAKPSDAIAEMNHLIDVYNESVEAYGPDAVIAGDLNADCSYVCKSCWDQVKLKSDPRFNWLIADDVDTTVGNSDCAYDRVIVAGDELQQNSCCATVFRYDQEYEIDEELAKDISDHFPVEFVIY